jgi:translation initiation factor 2B subunit (eIF-2B alpha/beta/delta family)
MKTLHFPPSIQDLVSKIGREKKLGASVIAKWCADCYLEFAKKMPAKTFEEFFDALFILSKELIFSQPDMAPIFTIANQVLTAVQGAKTLPKAKEAVVAQARKAITFGQQAREEMARLGVSLIEEGDTILTHSHSSSVKYLLERAHKSGKSFDVIVTESRPGLEGKVLAEELGRLGIATTLIVEAAALGVLSRCQKVFVGADRLSEEHFINKVGTRAIALGAKELERDFFVVCDTSKFVPARFGSFTRKQHPSEEVMTEHFPNVIVENPYFETIPLSLVTVVVCEEGLLPPKGIGDYLQQKIHFPELLSSP